MVLSAQTMVVVKSFCKIPFAFNCLCLLAKNDCCMLYESMPSSPYVNEPSAIPPSTDRYGIKNHKQTSQKVRSQPEFKRTKCAISFTGLPVKSILLQPGGHRRLRFECYVLFCSINSPINYELLRTKLYTVGVPFLHSNYCRRTE